jgi:hypothetical protein
MIPFQTRSRCIPNIDYKIYTWNCGIDVSSPPSWVLNQIDVMTASSFQGKGVVKAIDMCKNASVLYTLHHVTYGIEDVVVGYMFVKFEKIESSSSLARLCDNHTIDVIYAVQMIRGQVMKDKQSTIAAKSIADEMVMECQSLVASHNRQEVKYSINTDEKKKKLNNLGINIEFFIWCRTFSPFLYQLCISYFGTSSVYPKASVSTPKSQSALSQDQHSKCKKSQLYLEYILERYPMKVDHHPNSPFVFPGNAKKCDIYLVGHDLLRAQTFTDSLPSNHLWKRCNVNCAEGDTIIMICFISEKLKQFVQDEKNKTKKTMTKSASSGDIGIKSRL